jgi:hypothetical protein
LDHGVLTIEGTRRADAIVVNLDSPTSLRVTVNGRDDTFARSAVSRINIFTGLGDDLVGLFKRDPNLALDVMVSGGAGNDNLASGGGNDTLLGDAGDDTLRGGAGRDRLHGGGGKDRLFGDGGRDLLYGEGSNDYLHGGYDADALVGGRGSDVFYRPAPGFGIGIGSGPGLQRDEEFVDVDAGDRTIDEPANILPITTGSYYVIKPTTPTLPTIPHSTYSGGSSCLCINLTNPVTSHPSTPDVTEDVLHVAPSPIVTPPFAR